MQLYETTFIVNPQTDDASLDRQVRAVADLITTSGGRIVHEDRMGTRRLAYPIKGLTQGYYTSIVFEGPAEVLPPLTRHFKLGEAYLRHLTILFEGDVEALAAGRQAEPAADSRADARPRRPESPRAEIPSKAPARVEEPETEAEIPGRRAVRRVDEPASGATEEEAEL
ncbi:MAG TPA: 30S ribosomal protein S6 [Candidatus Deferrimicrobium sp.]|nr:30S ribosomal protein S6 [Candidatus Deferrimicrobium sp.]